jgi:hypothetical protein
MRLRPEFTIAGMLATVLRKLETTGCQQKQRETVGKSAVFLVHALEELERPIVVSDRHGG